VTPADEVDAAVTPVDGVEADDGEGLPPNEMPYWALWDQPGIDKSLRRLPGVTWSAIRFVRAAGRRSFLLTLSNDVVAGVLSGVQVLVVGALLSRLLADADPADAARAASPWVLVLVLSMPAILTAAQRSGADRFVRRRPEGYDSILGRMFDTGQDLSVGQWRRVAVARAFFRDAPFVILDEPDVRRALPAPGVGVPGGPSGVERGQLVLQPVAEVALSGHAVEELSVLGDGDGVELHRREHLGQRRQLLGVLGASDARLLVLLELEHPLLALVGQALRQGTGLERASQLGQPVESVDETVPGLGQGQVTDDRIPGGMRQVESS
jgi:ABC transporter